MPIKKEMTKSSLQAALKKALTKIQRLEAKLARLELENNDLREELAEVSAQFKKANDEISRRSAPRSTRQCRFCGRSTRANHVSAGGVGPMCDSCFNDMCQALGGSY
jgi:septal ring factor EnvC (AmiA/AmiB activator)